MAGHFLESPPIPEAKMSSPHRAVVRMTFHRVPKTRWAPGWLLEGPLQNPWLLEGMMVEELCLGSRGGEGHRRDRQGAIGGAVK